jgi:SOS response associated peptidase (SRAP)
VSRGRGDLKDTRIASANSLRLLPGAEVAGSLQPVVVNEVVGIGTLDQVSRPNRAWLAESLGVETPASDRGIERFNIAPTQEVLAVVQDRDGRRIEELRWGLVPHWAKELRTRFSMINARAETLKRKPAYRPLARSPGTAA